MGQNYTRTINDKGFTLIELIATLVITSIIGLGVSSFLVYGVEGFMLAKANNEVFQKANLAIERLIRETNNLDEIYETTPNSIHYKRDGQEFGIALVGTNIQLNRAGSITDATPGSILIDNITAFSLQFEDVDGSNWTIPADNSITGLSIIKISMTIAIQNTTRTFSVEINPLYNNMVDGPTS